MNISFRLVNVFKKDSQSYQSLGSSNYLADIDSCLALVRLSPVYSTSLDRYLPAIWETLLIEKRMSLAMIEATEDAHNGMGKIVRPVGFRFTCFISGEFYRSILRRAEHKTLEPRVCTDLYDKHKRANRLNKSPILTRREIAQANAREGEDGLFAFSFTFHEDPILETLVGVQSYAKAVVESIEEMLKGYWIEGVISEHYNTHAKIQLPRTGFEIIEEYGQYYKRNDHIAENHRLFLAHVDRSILQKPEKVGTMAYYGVTLRRPEFDLTFDQRELLEFLWEGATNSILAQHYQTGEDAIRQRFSLIYNKVRKVRPDLFKNGTERANLLAYLKDHYEEFRPYDGPIRKPAL